tara:strand:+ start:452 stop:817 length:366 start_codon:yes stop_codon:yes gene_type:complete
MIHVVNINNHDETPNDYFIGRGSNLGNIYTSIKDRKTKALYTCNSREESVSLYEIYLLEQIEAKHKHICDTLNEIYLKALKEDVYLVCYCHPKLCHGEVIKKIIENKILIKVLKDTKNEES